MNIFVLEQKMTLINIHNDLKTTLDFRLQLILCLQKGYNDAKRGCHNRFLWACSVMVHCHASEPPLDQWHSISSLNSNLICSLWQIRTGISKKEMNSLRKKKKCSNHIFDASEGPVFLSFWLHFVGTFYRSYFRKYRGSNSTHEILASVSFLQGEAGVILKLVKCCCHGNITVHQGSV